MSFYLNDDSAIASEHLPNLSLSLSSALGGAMFDTMEFPLSQASSFHWHGKCNYADMHSCSPV